MKKITTLVALFTALVLVSCKKQTDELLPQIDKAPTLVKSGTDLTVSPPKNGVEFTYAIVGGGSDVGTTRFQFNWSGTATLANFDKFVCEILKDSDSSIVFKSTAFNLQTNGILYTNSFLKKGGRYTVKFRTNVLNGTDGKNFKLLVNMQCSDKDYDPTGFKESSMVTFGLPKLTLHSDPNTPESKQVLGGSEVSTVNVPFDMQGSGTFTNIAVDVSTPAAVSSVNVYDSLGSLLGSTSNFSGNTFNVPVNYSQTDGWGSLVVKLQLKNVTSATGSNVNVRTNVTGISFKTSDGTTKNSSGSATGKDMYVFKTTEIVTSNSPTSAIQNGVVMTFNTTTFFVNGASKKAQKLLSWNTSLIDHGPNVDSIKIFQLGIKVNGIQLLPGTFYFTTEAGLIIDTLLPGNKKIYVTFVNEVIKQPGINMVFDLTGIAQGFNHQDGDEFSSTLMMNDTWSANRFLNSGIPTNGVLARSFSSNTPSSLAVVVDYLSSDYSSGVGHSDGLASGNDWFNSALIEANISQQVRKK